MDITAAVASGLISGLVGLAVGIIGLRLFGKRAIMGLLTDFSHDEALQTEINAQIDAVFWNKFNYALQFIHDNPQKLTPILTGLMGDLQKALPKEAMGQVIQGALTDNAEAIAGNGALLQFVPRKWRGPVAILQMLMGGGSAGEKKPESSGFG